MLNDFCHSIESRAINSFWNSRKKGNIRQNPEMIAQDLFSLFVAGTLVNRSGIQLKEFQSGIGFVDFGIIFSSILHLVEIKVLTKQFQGPSQLEQYMKNENRREGSLLVFDARDYRKKTCLPKRIDTQSGIIKVYQVDINPLPPSRK